MRCSSTSTSHTNLHAAAAAAAKDTHLDGGDKWLEQLRLTELAQELERAPPHVLVGMVQVVPQGITHLAEGRSERVERFQKGPRMGKGGACRRTPTPGFPPEGCINSERMARYACLASST